MTEPTYLDNGSAACVLADYTAFVLSKGTPSNGSILLPLMRDVVSALAASGYRLVALPDETPEELEAAFERGTPVVVTAPPSPGDQTGATQ